MTLSVLSSNNLSSQPFCLSRLPLAARLRKEQIIPVKQRHPQGHFRHILEGFAFSSRSRLMMLFSLLYISNVFMTIAMLLFLGMRRIHFISFALQQLRNRRTPWCTSAAFYCLTQIPSNRWAIKSSGRL